MKVEYKIILLFFLLLNTTFAKAQDTAAINKKLHYRITIGTGLGSGPSNEDYYGVGIMSEFSIQRKNSIYALKILRVEQLETSRVAQPLNSNNCLDITYGKIFNKGPFLCSTSAGISFIEGIRIIQHLTTAGWDVIYNYEKTQLYTVGIPISAKIFWMPKKDNKRFGRGLGIELFANLNNKNTFYGMNICFQFILRNKIQ